MMENILSILIFFPLVAAFVIFLFLRGGKTTMWATFIATIIEFILTIPLMTSFDKTTAAMQFVEKADWIPALAFSTM
ncbi:MAG: hypothetical protein LRY51_03725 [Geovibrio sp.]|nr:hypothetical protein [Geovibrio sp.]